MEFGRCGRREIGKDRGRRGKQCVNKNEGVTAEALESCGRGFHHQISSSENQNAKIAVGSVAAAMRDFDTILCLCPFSKHAIRLVSLCINKGCD